MEITITKDLINKQADKIGMARWHKAQITLSQFRGHVIGLGGAFAVATYEDDKRRDDKFILSELIGLDFDEGNHTLEALLNHPLIGKYAGLIYASPSHTHENPKWRVVFFLASPITDKGRYADYVGRLLASIDNDLAGLDTVAKDSARLFFGHKLAPHDEGVLWYANDTARLPIAILDGLPRLSSGNGKKRGGIGKPSKNTIEIGTIEDVMSDEQFTELAKNLPTQALNALKILIATRKGRNAQLYATARIFNDCLVSSDTAYSILHRACVVNGYIAKDGASAFESSFLSAYGNLPTPRLSGNRQAIDEDVSYLNNLSFADEFSNADNVMNVAYPYITQMRDDELSRVLNHRLVMVKSPTGTGKSTLQSRIIEFWAGKLPQTPRVLVITHRRALVQEIATKNGFITYAEITNPSMKGVNTTIESNVTTFDSLWRYEGAKFDLVMIDEAVQALEHLASSSTLKADRITPLRVLEDVMKNARQTLAFDANFSHGAGQWLENILSAHRKSSIRLVNTTRPNARPLDVWHDRSAFLARVFTSANDGFTTLACSSVNDARLVNRLASDIGIRTLLVCSDNSDNQDVKEKVARINTLADIDLLIYSPSLGTGIDITRPVKGAYLMARPRPLSGDDLVQMLSRARHADTYGAFGVMSHGDEHTPLKSDDIYTDLLQITRATLGTLPDTDNGDYLNSARLYSILQADKERQFCDKQAFIKSAIANGFTFRMSYATGHDESIEKAFKGAIADDKQWRKDTALTIAPLSDEDIENLRKAGNMSYSAKMANLRYHIEYMTGQAIDEGLYTALNTPEKRARVMRLSDVLAEADEVKIGNAKMNAGRAYQDIRARNVQRALMLELIAIMGFSTIADLRMVQNVTRDELITPALESWLNRNSIVIRQAFGRYRQTDNPITELRAFLRAYGVKLASNQIRQGDDFIMVYGVDSALFDETLGLADMVLNATRARVFACVQNADNSPTAKFTHTTHHTPHTQFIGANNPFSKARGVPTSP